MVIRLALSVTPADTYVKHVMRFFCETYQSHRVGGVAQVDGRRHLRHNGSGVQEEFTGRTAKQSESDIESGRDDHESPGLLPQPHACELIVA